MDIRKLDGGRRVRLQWPPEEGLQIVWIFAQNIWTAWWKLGLRRNIEVGNAYRSHGGIFSTCDFCVVCFMCNNFRHVILHDWYSISLMPNRGGKTAGVSHKFPPCFEYFVETFHIKIWFTNKKTYNRASGSIEYSHDFIRKQHTTLHLLPLTGLEIFTSTNNFFYEA
jgi:hypothetical protein